MRQKLSFSGAFRKGDPDLPYRYVPFEMPPGAGRVEVSYHFQRDDDVQPKWGADDVVDIGVFDQRGTEFLEAGFRGWSGGARRSFFIDSTDATPGYLRGPLEPGEWNVFLGARILHSDVMPYWINVSIDSDPEAPAEPLPTKPAPAPGATVNRATGWYRGDFHSHTEHSDGYNSIDEYATAAGRRGLDFLAITDHNTCSHFEEIAARPLRDGLLLIPGEEVTTFWGHANVWGLGRWTDFRVSDDGGMQRVLDWVEERGGLFSPNHPKRGWPWEFDKVRDFRVVEAWQGAWRFYNEESLAFWAERLDAGARVVAVGGSDCHSIPPAINLHPWTLGDPCTWVYAQGGLSEAGVLDAVRAGHVFVSEDPTGPFLELTATCDGRDYLMGDAIDAPEGALVRFRLRYRGPAKKKLRLVRDGAVWQEVIAEREEQTLEFEAPLAAPGYVRAEAAGFRGRPERGEVVHALTNPLYLRPTT
ncbi:MAG: CehA/McbA family metallohydrolase [Dehalococcoidia bacterium]